MNIMYVLTLFFCTVLTTYGMETGDGEIESPITCDARSFNNEYRAVGYENGWVKVFAQDGSETQKMYMSMESIQALHFNSQGELVVVYYVSFEEEPYNRELVMKVGKEHPARGEMIVSQASDHAGILPAAN